MRRDIHLFPEDEAIRVSIYSEHNTEGKKILLFIFVLGVRVIHLYIEQRTVGERK